MFLKYYIRISVFVIPCIFPWFSLAAQSPDASWLNATEQTRQAVAQLQAQAQANNMQQQEQQAAQQELLRRGLQTIIEQQDAIIKNTDNSTAQSDAPVFQPRPREPKQNLQTNNPYLTPNPWRDTQQNPYAGQKYTPPVTNYQSDGIYVKPQGNTDNTENSATGPAPINIFK